MMLATKYRPRNFDDVVGQRATTLVLGKMVRMGRIPSGLLFCGSKGTGKTTASRIVGAFLNCVEVEKPCGKCDVCEAIFAGVGLDVIEIDAASNGGVQDMRSLTEMLSYRGNFQTRVVLIDEAHALTAEAFKALLKTIEEPPPNTIFILVTTKPDKIPDTIQSRLMTFEFHQVSIADIAERLTHIVTQESIIVEADLISEIATRASGDVRKAIMTLDQIVRVGIETLNAFNEIFDKPDFGPELLKFMVLGNVASVFDFANSQLSRFGDPDVVSSQLISVLTDVMVLRAGGALSCQGLPLVRRQEISSLCEPDRAFGALRILWELGTKTHVAKDPRVALDLALVMCTEALSGKLHKHLIKKTPVVERMSLEEMQI